MIGWILTPAFSLRRGAAVAAKSSLRVYVNLPPFPSPLPQGSQDSTGGQEGLVAPPFTAFPPPPPPQNGLPGTEFGPGAMFGAGGQGTPDVGAGANGAPTAPTNNSSNVSSTCSREPLFMAEIRWSPSLIFSS